MLSANSSKTNQRTKSMTEEQFEEILNAILAGKYSWACVLILRVAGYNPLHYIPYRTYNRLIKDNRLATVRDKSSQNSSSLHQSNSCSGKGKIQDLDYLKEVNNEEQKVMGGNKKWHILGIFK
ncbi:HetP protein [Cyanobacterium stanieri PCC 7202]|uniref:HetP protein n=1 Tax=Cyanobacterium stanieri (strain ATCC 29140 / PCC 7202) TaxID=292563 RepID=K9YI27_CYASC|nr:HetP protein [Cyanobacterium stanieri PCC 7202]